MILYIIYYVLYIIYYILYITYYIMHYKGGCGPPPAGTCFMLYHSREDCNETQSTLTGTREKEFVDF